MDALLIYCDPGAPSKYLRFLEAGVAHQVLTDGGLTVSSVLLHADRSADEVVEAFRAHPAKFVAFCLDEFNSRASLHLINRLGSAFPDTPICVFGVFATLAPEKAVQNPHVDFLLIGESEIALYELVSNAIRGEDTAGIKNLWWKHDGGVRRNPLRPLQENLDVIPYPNRAFFEQEPASGPKASSTLYVMASRGCPYDCLFCYSPVLKRSYEGKGTYYRARSAQNVAGEILGELRRGNYSAATFVDEVFPTDKNWLRALGQRLGGKNALPFQCVLQVERVDMEVLDLLKASGCNRIVLGVETGSENFRKRVATRNLSNDRVRAVVQAARERDIAITTTNMLALPLESEPLSQETYTFNQALAPDEIRSTVFQPITGTGFETYVSTKEIAAPGSDSTEVDFTRVAVQLPELSPDAVRGHLFRLHFLNLVQKMKTLPKTDSYLDLLSELPRAKFKMQRTAAVDVGSATRAGTPIGYLSLECGSEVRWAVNLRPGTVFRFALLLPESSFLRLKHHNARITAEVLFQKDGEQTPIFSRMITGGDAALVNDWKVYSAACPEEAGAGEFILRVVHVEGRCSAYVFWGMPGLADQDLLLGSNAAVEQMRSQYENQVKLLNEDIAQLRTELQEAQQREAAARLERDEKARRVSELHMKVLELEKRNSEMQVALSQFERLQQAGLGEKFKGMFKK